MSEKIKAQHLGRKAILSVRQSSAYQVKHNLESPKLQYGMEERLQQLGWREIEVVDEDLGRDRDARRLRTHGCRYQEFDPSRRLPRDAKGLSSLGLDDPTRVSASAQISA